MIEEPRHVSRLPDPSEHTIDGVLLLQHSGLFDGAWFLDRNPDLAPHGGAGALRHFHEWGWREHRWPNAYFDPAWYLAQNPDIRERDENPLLHYAIHGERQGRPPIAWFDPGWYRRHHHVPPEMLALAHFLLHRMSGQVSPVPEFDGPHYLTRYPDIAGMDPFEHYLVRGATEDRQPHPAFDPVFYRDRYLRQHPEANPVLHYRAHRHQPGIHPARPEHDTDIPREVRRNTRPGPLFEEWAPCTPQPRAKLLAFYLPQFHAVPENDTWWGKGFTEWTNVARALPRFAGHYQPRIPRDLGHYSLEGAATLRRQAAMALASGLHGFVFYHYWFNGRRLLNGPIDALLADRSIDLPFCLMWANENWTRRWDGSDDEVLLSQDYREADEAGFVADLMRHFVDPRYIRLAGRPVLMVYRASAIPEGAIQRWRQMFAAKGERPFFVMAQSFDDRDPRPLGMDAAVEFPPHKLTNGLAPRNAELVMLDHEATARVYAYDDVAAAADLTPPPYPLIRTVLPGWDNDARRQGAGMTLHGATPAAYQAWLERSIDAARSQPVGGEALVCINAWNEWAEGAYLEPDVHFGAAFLNATARAAAPRTQAAARPALLLVGHDAFPAGSQLLLLHLGRALRETTGIEILFLLLGDGALLPRYQEVAPTVVLAGLDDLATYAASLAAQGLRHAIVNTCAAARALAPLDAAGMACTLMVHELPRLLLERRLVEPARAAVGLARTIVFAAAHVRDRFTELVPLPQARSTLLMQGLYRPVAVAGREAMRARLRVPVGGTLAIGIGYADLRKGFDLFLQAWRVAQRRDGRTHFLWVGDLDPTLAAYLGPEIAAAEATGTFHRHAFAEDGADWLAAADVHLLTSREDPMPTVVMEAMSAGLPTIAFEESGGAPDLLREHAAGSAVPMGDVPAMVRRMRMAPRDPAARTQLGLRARRAFDFDRYAVRLLTLAYKEATEVSAVVPSYNYARYLPARLDSIFAQTHPVAEVVVLDDASTDDSEAAAHTAAAAAGRRIQWVANELNSGSLFRQWRRAAELARGELLWIAEADDSCEPGLLAALHAAMRTPGVVMAFCDARAIDAAGAPLWPDHKAYFAESGAHRLAADTLFEAEDALRCCLAERNLILNVSGVLFRRTALLAALVRCEAALDGFGGAGDWRVYAEMLAAGGRVAYVAQPLNVHRRHEASVTAATPPDSSAREAARMRRHVRGLLGRMRELERQEAQAGAQAEVQAGAQAGY